MFLKLQRGFLCLFALLMMLAGSGIAQAPVSSAADKTASIRGHLADQTGALIPGTKVTLTNALGITIASTSSDAQGVYAFTGLAAGTYIVQTSVEGFAPFTSPTLHLAAGQFKRVDVSMAVLAEQQNVVVTDDADNSVSVDAGSNVSAVVLKDKDLDAFSDDPDELQNELSALAGPSAGPNGGQIYIDGFTGGTLPPKSAIREIRINQNPFSAEFDRIGYGRIEILTKPGTDKFHGRGFVQGNDKSFNTSNPFKKDIPDYHSVQYNGTVSGALSKTSSFFLSIEGRNIQDASIYSGYQAKIKGSDYVMDAVSGGLFAPSTRFELSPRLDLQLGAKHTLTTRFQYERSTSSGSLGSTSLPSTATSSNSAEYSLQFSDSYIINDHIVNETRGQFRRAISSSSPASTGTSYGVSSYFSDGGNSSQFTSDHSDHMELQNVTTMSAGAHAIKFGGWLRDNRTASFSNSNFNGSFSFKSLNTYLATLEACEGVSGVSCVSTTTAPKALQVDKLTYTTGPTNFRANVFDAALFFQDDWKFNRFLTLSGGLRLESQNHIADHVDLAPRLAFAYALDGHKKGKQTKTVLRGGYGFFYDRFGVSSLLSLASNDGSANSQQKTVISNPSCFSQTSLSGVLANCGTGSTSTSQIQSLDANYHSPYNEQLGISVERQISKTVTLSGTYVHTYGVHQSATRNSNAYQPTPGTFYYNSTTGTRPNPTGGIVNEIYPEAVFKQNQLIVNTNMRLSPKFNIMGFYNLNYGNGNTGTASNSWNLSQDYGRTSFVRRNMVFLMGNYTGPWGLTFNPFLVAQSGRSFNIVTNSDLTGDNYFNNRPAFAAAYSCATSNARYVQTSYGCFDVTPDASATPIPINLGKGPAAVAVNLRISRSIGIGPKLEAAGQGNGGPRPGSYMGGPGGGGPGGGPGGGVHGGGGRGGPGGGLANTGHKYSLNFSAQALNLFNNIDYGTPSGVIVPTKDTNGLYGPGNRFGTSTTLAGGMFASPSSAAARRIFIMAAFSF